MNNVQKPRIESLQTLADHYGSDPYSLSLKVRKRFRVEKKVEKEKQETMTFVLDKCGVHCFGDVSICSVVARDLCARPLVSHAS